jgi:two-component system aerobic respiration control sensor histidine kinase ArcB
MLTLSHYMLPIQEVPYAEFYYPARSPRKLAELAVTSDQEIETHPVSAGRVLIVEDDEMQRSILQAVLEAEGFEVAVSDGYTAVSRIRDGGYDVVLLDYLLPDTSGLAIARLIHDKMDESARPRLIALTALPDIIVGQEMVSMKVFDDIVGKSFDLTGLAAIVTTHVRASRRMLASRMPGQGDAQK